MERIESRQNSLIARMRKLQASPALRRSEGVFVGDGIKLLGEAVKWGGGLEAVLLCDGVEPPEGLPEGVRTAIVSRELMEFCSELPSPQGALFICRAPELTDHQSLAPSRVLVLDGVQDPGNVGTILRTADAMELELAVLTGPCADPLGVKAIRSSMGAIFRQRYVRVERTDLPELLAGWGLPLYAAALSESARDIRSFSLERCAVAIGSEGRGVSQEIIDASAAQLIIPMSSRCESLNAAVAASIVLWEFRRGEK